MTEYTATQLREMLQTKFPAPRYAYLEEVGNATGFDCKGWIDAIVVSLWPSDGLTRYAYEIKVARSDFLRELEDPKKSAWVKEYCHGFWFVAPAGVIKVEELPDGVGWLKPHGGVLTIVRHARYHANPPMDDKFLAALCRAAIRAGERDKRKILESLRMSDPEYATALRWKMAAEKFLAMHDIALWRHDKKDDVESILAILNSATHTKELDQVGKNVSDVLWEFQGRMAGLFKAFMVLSHIALDERDATVSLVATYLGSTDAYSAAERKAKPGKKYRTDSDVIAMYKFLTNYMKQVKKEAVAEDRLLK